MLPRASTSLGTARASVTRCRRCHAALQVRELRLAASSATEASTSKTTSWTHVTGFYYSSRYASTSASGTAGPAIAREGPDQRPQTPQPRLRTQYELYTISSDAKRPYLYNDKTAQRFVDAMGLAGRSNLTVLDLYAGPGVLSQSILDCQSVSQMVAVEDIKIYADSLQAKVEANAGRFAHIHLDPFWWDTYRVIRERGLLDGVQKKAWEDDSPNLVLTGVFPPNLNSEKLLIQMLSCIAGQIWLYQHGRFQSFYLVHQKFLERIMAPPGTKKRHKLAVLLEPLVEIRVLIPSSDLKPQQDHLKANQSRKVQYDYSLVSFTPHPTKELASVEDLEILDYLARNLFIHKGAKWTKALKYLAPGATILQELAAKQGHAIDPNKQPTDLDKKDWLALLAAFKAWPFRPMNVLHNDLATDD